MVSYKIKLLILFSLIHLLTYSNAQILNDRVGFYFHIDGVSIENVIDFDFEPEKKLDVTYDFGTGFSPGHYYKKDGQKVLGLIRYLQNTTDFKFKASPADKPLTISSESCLGFVIGIDSFATLDFSRLSNKKKNQSNTLLFAEVIERAGNLHFYRQFNIESSTTELRYFVKYDSSEYFLEFPKKQPEFAALSAKVFNISDGISKQIRRGMYRFDNILSLIKSYRYAVAFLNNEKISLNSSFNELWQPETTYFSRVESIVDSIYRISYYKDDKGIVFTGEYTSFNPVRKNGESIYYYTNGSVRKKLAYKDNKLISGVNYFENGKTYQVFERTDDELIFKEVYDSIGQPILNSNGSGNHSLYDLTNKRTVTHQYENYKLITAFYLNQNNEKVYQYFSSNAKLKTGADIQSLAEHKIKYPIESIQRNNYGLVLLSCQVDLKGKIGDIKIIKGIDPWIDDQVVKFLPYIRAYNVIDTGKLNGERVLQEVVIPIDFSLMGFTRTQIYNGNFWAQGGLALQRSLMRALIR